MSQAKERPGRLDGDPDLLQKLAPQRLDGRLAGLDLAAWKLPHPRQVLSRRTLRDEHAPAPIDQRRRDDV
jgi:hypothetical protein